MAAALATVDTIAITPTTAVTSTNVAVTVAAVPALISATIRWEVIIVDAITVITCRDERRVGPSTAEGRTCRIARAVPIRINLEQRARKSSFPPAQRHISTIAISNVPVIINWLLLVDKVATRLASTIRPFLIKIFRAFSVKAPRSGRIIIRFRSFTAVESTIRPITFNHRVRE